MTTEINTGRAVQRIISSIRTVEGGGFVVRRPFPTNKLLDFDPFLMLDHMGPVNYGPGEAIGAPDHPHRGFETVSYVLEGQMQHKDSRGHAGKIGPGDVQWMTAGSGIVHSEMPSDEIMQNGGSIHGFQIWVNLPAKDKMIKPYYQEIPTTQIPTAYNEKGDVKVKVIAGESFGTKAAIATRTPIMYLHFTLQPGAEVQQPIPQDFNVFAYVVDGQGLFDRTKSANEGDMVIFDKEGEVVTIANPATNTQPLNVFILGGVPINEPVARYGPFVMNTQREIIQAINDYNSGKMGSIDF